MDYYNQSQFVSNIKDIHGEVGIKWLEQLPKLIRQLEKDWKIKVISSFSNLTYSFVATVELEDESQAVLKIAPRNNRSDWEIEWYRLQMRSVPKLYKFSQNIGALLIEKLVPGKSAKDFVIEGKDDEATQIICTVIEDFEALHISSNIYFKHVLDLESDLNILEDKIESYLLDKAKALFKDLTDKSNNVMLHGDLHHDNILSSENTWKAIDPHGYIGPKAFEVGAMLRNPYDCFPTDLSLEEVIKRRRNILHSELSFPTWEIDGWLFVYTMIATGWSVEDHNEVPAKHMDIIKILYQFMS